MNKAEKKFRIYAIFVIFALLTALLAVINGVNFTMAAGDADEITQMLADRQGTFDHREPEREFPAGKTAGNGFSMGPMGPGSPELNASLRYFTIVFSDNGGTGETAIFKMSAVTESEAAEWARGLLSETTGWTRGTYRYRVYKIHGATYVTVIDQGRELLPSFRILIISAVGELLVLVTGWFVLLGIGRRIYAPMEEADRKQKNFIANANREFRLPLTIINGNTELAERKYGPDEQTRSTHRQIARLNELVDKLGSAVIFENDSAASEVPLSELLYAALDVNEEKFAARGIAVTPEIEPGITVCADHDAMNGMLGEIVENAAKYALTKAEFRLKKENGYILLEAKNDSDLPDGQLNQAFDRFTTLQNAAPESHGLGLSDVKETVKACNGRATAEAENGIFTLRITL